MSQRITILPEIITNKIAAGEVVERPASVVKELIENSLDAGATDIAVDITNGGKRLIRITDNGHGMSREDALLSLERHATSKIRHDSDLDGILTLGFRGEALPSIASVARLRLTTREYDSPEGTEISIEGGKIRDVRACGMAPGTVISVEHIFFNTPARLKFLKSPETEAGHVADVITRMAVSRPEVAFCLTSEGRELIKVQRSNLQRRLSQLVGKDSASHLFELTADGEQVIVSGFVSDPGLARSGTNAIFTYINGRFVRDKVVQHAIMQAYRGVIDRGRYPVVALFIELAAGDVDVNVHPTKHEVRFRQQACVHDAIQDAVAEVLRLSPWLTQRAPVSERVLTNPATQSNLYRERIAAAAQASLALPRREYTPYGSQTAAPGSTPVTASQQDEATNIREPVEPFQADSPSPAQPQGYFSSFSIIGQFHGEYILCQSGSDLVIIDQHAASERVAFQRLRQQFQQSGIESQRLLFPLTLEVSFAEMAVASRFQQQLAGIGFELEPFGGNTLLISAVPRLIAEKDSSRLMRDLLHELGQMGTSSAFNDCLDELFSRIACHSVVRGFHTLEQRQISELLRSMDETDFAASCPHGRPVSHTITLSELEKIFKRT